MFSNGFARSDFFLPSSQLSAVCFLPSPPPDSGLLSSFWTDVPAPCLVPQENNRRPLGSRDPTKATTPLPTASELLPRRALGVRGGRQLGSACPPPPARCAFGTRVDRVDRGDPLLPRPAPTRSPSPSPGRVPWETFLEFPSLGSVFGVRSSFLPISSRSSHLLLPEAAASFPRELCPSPLPGGAGPRPPSLLGATCLRVPCRQVRAPPPARPPAGPLPGLAASAGRWRCGLRPGHRTACQDALVSKNTISSVSASPALLLSDPTLLRVRPGIHSSLRSCFVRVSVSSFPDPAPTLITKSDRRRSSPRGIGWLG